jgi:hypothetical protein
MEPELNTACRPCRTEPMEAMARFAVPSKADISECWQVDLYPFSDNRISLGYLSVQLVLMRLRRRRRNSLEIVRVRLVFLNLLQ